MSWEDSRNLKRSRDDRSSPEDDKGVLSKSSRRGRSRSTSPLPSSSHVHSSSMKKNGLNFASDIPMAVVTESNGEISCSIEESNRIRAILGLKPLKLDQGVSAEAQAVLNFKVHADEQQKKLKTQDAMDRIAKARNKRLMKSKMEGKTLGELTEEEESLGLGGASNWVERSRLRAAEDKILNMSLKKNEDDGADQGYSADNLMGVELMHGEKDFKVGESVILTLADSNLLNTNERGQVLGLNTDNDVLENINMTEDEKRIDREKKKKRLRQPIYTGYDDAEFEDDTAVGTRPKILPQYDEEAKRGPQLRLGEGGVVTTSNTEIKANRIDTKGIPQSLKVENTKQALAEYLTPAEFASFNKPKKEKVKKKRKIRKKESSSGLIEELEAALDVKNGSTIQRDHGSRNETGQTMLSRLEAHEKKQRDAYASAVKVANEKNETISTYSARSSAEMKEEDEDDEDDADIVLSLARARRLALSQKSNTPSVGNESFVLDRIQNSHPKGQIFADESFDPSSKGAFEGKSDHEHPSDDFVDGDGRRKDGTLVFTSTTEFTTRLRARLQEKARSKSAAAIKQMELDGGSGGDESDEDEDKMDVEVERDKMQRSWVELEDVSENECNDYNENDQAVGEKEAKIGGDTEILEEVEFGSQPIVAQGMAATLALLKSSGDLQKKKDLAGRAKDSRDQDPSAVDYGVKLEYRDEYGRKMTQKEAFRQLSYKFHGIQPGKKKKAKRLKEYEDELRAASSKGKAENSSSMRSLTRAQAVTGKAHLTVQGGSLNSTANIAAAVAKKLKKNEKSIK